MRALLLTFAFAACVPVVNAPVGHYVVEPVHGEVVADTISAQWFSRQISDETGLRAVELVYCPIVRGHPPICRTAVIWQRDQSALLSGR